MYLYLYLTVVVLATSLLNLTRPTVILCTRKVLYNVSRLTGRGACGVVRYKDGTITIAGVINGKV